MSLLLFVCKWEVSAPTHTWDIDFKTACCSTCVSTHSLWGEVKSTKPLSHPESCGNDADNSGCTGGRCSQQAALDSQLVLPAGTLLRCCSVITDQGSKQQHQWNLVRDGNSDSIAMVIGILCGRKSVAAQQSCSHSTTCSPQDQALAVTLFLSQCSSFDDTAAA